MKRILRIDRDVKVRRAKVKEIRELPLDGDVEAPRISTGLSDQQVRICWQGQSMLDLSLFRGSGITLKTTNCMKSLMALDDQKMNKGDDWENSNQRRW